MRAGREDGFTLVELLVALAIVGAVAALLSASLWSGHSAVRRGHAAGAAGETVAAAQAVLRERIERLAPADAAATSADPLLATATGFSLLAPPADALGQVGTQRATVSLGGDGRVMLATTDAGRAIVLPLIDGARALEFAYYGPAAGDPTPRWRGRWTQDDPPRLVRVRVRFAPGDLRTWPDLIVHPAVTAAAGCTVDPQHGTCA